MLECTLACQKKVKKHKMTKKMYCIWIIFVKDGTYVRLVPAFSVW